MLLDLPLALGGAWPRGEAVWTQEAGRQEVAEGQSVVSYQSGLTFRWLTPKQRAGLTAALEILQATQKA